MYIDIPETKKMLQDMKGNPVKKRTAIAYGFAILSIVLSITSLILTSVVLVMQASGASW